MNPHRFKVDHESNVIGYFPSAWAAREAAVAYMQQREVSPVRVVDTEYPVAGFGISFVHIEAFEGSPEVVAARRLLQQAQT